MALAAFTTVCRWFGGCKRAKCLSGDRDTDGVNDKRKRMYASTVHTNIHLRVSAGSYLCNNLPWITAVMSVCVCVCFSQNLSIVACVCVCVVVFRFKHLQKSCAAKLRLQLRQITCWAYRDIVKKLSKNSKKVLTIL